MVTWKHIDGTSTIVDKSISDEELLRVFEEAVKTMKGQFPSINSRETIEGVLDAYRKLDRNE